MSDAFNPDKCSATGVYLNGTYKTVFFDRFQHSGFCKDKKVCYTGSKDDEECEVNILTVLSVTSFLINN